MSFRFHRSDLDIHVAGLSEEVRREILRESADFERTGKIAEDAKLRRAAEAYLERLESQPSSPALFLSIFVNAVHRFYSMQTMEKVLGTPEPWVPGQPVTPETHVLGRDFRIFYQEGWDAQWWHDDSEIACEDETGTWILPEDDVFPLEKLGYLVWQGQDRASDWMGETRKTHDMIPIWHGFARWAAEQAPNETPQNLPGTDFIDTW